MIQIQLDRFAYKQTTVLEKISLELEEGKTFGVAGINGSGKTTFFNLLAGFLKAEAPVLLDSVGPVQKKDIAFLETELFFYPGITGGEFLSVFPKASENYRESEMLQLFRLKPEKLIEEYSTGMKRKLLLLSAIKQNKKIYILDEPFNGLDLETNKILEEIIKVLNSRGKTVFISSHVLEPLLNISEEILLIKDKTINRIPKEGFFQLSNNLFSEFTSTIRQNLSSYI